MIGIYKITNKNTGKSYIGQSNDIERRFKEHQIAGKKSRIPVDIAIQKYGKDLFTYEVVEECLIDQLNEREEYWIKFYDTFNNGYNCNPGGNQSSIGENNGRAKLTESDVKIIRQAYANHERQKDVYELLMPEYKLEKVEVIKLIILNSKNKIINLIDLARGEIDCANLSINNLMTEIFRLRAKKFILVHNHPSGDSEPSKQDYEITNRILEVSNLLGIKMLDHITIGDGNYTSIMGRLN